MTDEYALEVVVAGYVSEAMWQHGHVRPTNDEARATAREILSIPRIAAGLAAMRVADVRHDLSLFKGADPAVPADTWSAASLPQSEVSGDVLITYGETPEEAVLCIAALLELAADTRLDA